MVDAAALVKQCWLSVTSTIYNRALNGLELGPLIVCSPSQALHCFAADGLLLTHKYKDVQYT